MALLGADFDSAVPADGESLNLGSSRIRDIKARLKSWAAVLFNLETGNLNDNVIVSDKLATLSPNPATNNSPAIAIPSGATSYRRVQVNSKGQVIGGDSPDIVSLIADASIPTSKLQSIPQTTRRFTNATTVAWTDRTPSNLGATYTIYGVASSYDPPGGVGLNTNLFVAVGSGGLIITSADGGATWTQRTSNVSVDLKAVCFGNGYFVAVGAPTGGNLTILYSSDGITWGQVAGANINGGAPLNQTLNGVCYGTLNGTTYSFVAVGTAGEVVYTPAAASPNPSSAAWTRRNVAIAEPFLAVAAGGTGSGADIRAFVVVGGSGATQRIYRSTDLTVAWTVTQGGSSAVAFNAVHYVSLGPGWCIVGAAGTINSATDLAAGTPWTAQASGVTANLTCVTSGNGVVIVAGALDTGVTQAVLSRGPLTSWQNQSANTVIARQANAIAFGGGVFVVVGASSATANGAVATVGLVPLPNETSQLRWQHFLSKVPEVVQMTYVCIDASGDGGYSQYDEVDVASTFRDEDAASTQDTPNTVWRNSTQVGLQVNNFQTAEWQPRLYHKSTQSGSPSQWTVVTMNRNRWAVKVTALGFV